MTKHIFITGGVVSSLGKGITSASIGLLLERRGLSVALQKFDPYINVDAGTMNPYQHGEVYVTDDGAETDLDLGHYQRFTNSALNRNSNITTGAVYDAVIRRERKGAYNGACVQVVPHITDEIKSRISAMGGSGVDVAIAEIGGTVGDIESLPFLEALRQFALDLGPENVAFLHLTYLPYVRGAGELKTKPSQHSVTKLREIGIQPDMLLVRTEKSIDEAIRKKLSLYCSVPARAVIEVRDVESTIYEVPLVIRNQGLDDLLCKHLSLPGGTPDLADWEAMVHTSKHPKGRVNIGIVGKYIELPDAYKSIYEALQHGGVAHERAIALTKINSENVFEDNVESLLSGLDGVLIPGGFGDRGIEGKILAARFCRENGVPYLGLCLGMQILVIEFCRNVVGLPDANSTEFDINAANPVIHMMEDQKSVTQRGGTMRLGQYKCDLFPGSHAHTAYGAEQVVERHRHRYEFNPAFRMRCEFHGMVFSGINPESGLIEIAEVREHPWMLGVQFHPELKSKPTLPHPLFRDFVGAALRYREQTNPNGTASSSSGSLAAAGTTPSSSSSSISGSSPSVNPASKSTADQPRGSTRQAGVATSP